MKEAKPGSCIASSHSDVALLLETKSNRPSPPHCRGQMRHGGGRLCLCKSDTVRACKAVGVCACVWGHARTLMDAYGGVRRHQSCLKTTVLAKWQRPDPAAPPAETLQTPYLRPPNTHPPAFPPVTPSPLHPHQLSLLYLQAPISLHTHTHTVPDMHTPPQNPGPHSHSLTHRCHTSLQIKFTLGPPLSKKPKERQRGNEIEGLTSLPGSRAHDRHLLNPFIHMSQDFTKVHAYLSASLC